MTLYRVEQYAPDGHNPPRDELFRQTCKTLEDARAIVRQRIGEYFADPDCAWGPPDFEVYGLAIVEAYNEDDSIGSGGYVICEVTCGSVV